MKIKFFLIVISIFFNFQTLKAELTLDEIINFIFVQKGSIIGSVQSGCVDYSSKNFAKGKIVMGSLNIQMIGKIPEAFDGFGIGLDGSILGSHMLGYMFLGKVYYYNLGFGYGLIHKFALNKYGGRNNYFGQAFEIELNSMTKFIGVGAKFTRFKMISSEYYEDYDFDKLHKNIIEFDNYFRCYVYIGFST